MVRAAILVGILASAAGATPRAGKVVRVERAATKFPGTPRICQVQNDPVSGAAGTCGGPQPQVGETIVVLDNQRVVGTVRITGASAYGDGACDQGRWMINGHATSGTVPVQQTYGVIDVPLDTHVAHVVAVDHAPAGLNVPTENILAAIDGNGDGAPDFEFLGYSCDDGGAPTTASSSQSCLDVWFTGGRRPERVRQDRLRNCF